MKPRVVGHAVDTNMDNRIALSTVGFSLVVDLRLRLDQPVEDQVGGFGTAIRNVAGQL